MERPLVAISGKVKSGKSTLLNALHGAVLLPAGPLEVTALPTYMVNSDRAGFFTVFYAGGRHCDLPISALAEFMAAPDPDAVRVVLYCPPSPLFEKISVIDLPGWGSTSEFTHNSMANTFLASADYDVRVQVITNTNEIGHNIGDEVLLPHKRVLVLNKLDDRIRWEDDSCSPEAVIDNAVSRCRDHLQGQLESTELMPEIVGCTSIAGLAAVVWNKTLIQRLLAAAKSGDLDRLSKAGLASIVNEAVIEKANAELRAWDRSNYQPAYPALRFALGIAMREGITSPDTLCQRLFCVSGIERVRSAIERAVACPLIKMRRQLLPKLIKSQTELAETQKHLYKMRWLIQTATHLGSKHLGSKHREFSQTEELRFYAASKPFFQEQSEKLAEQTARLRRKIESVRSQYIHHGNDLAMKQAASVS